MFYAIYQSGFAIYGVGVTLGEATQDAAQWLDPATDLSAITFLDTPGPQREDGGNLYARPCTKRLAQAVHEDGGDLVYTINENGWLDLPSTQ